MSIPPAPKLQSFDAASIAIVIGATGGIGRAFVKHLRDCGRFDGVIELSRSTQPAIAFAEPGTLTNAAAFVRDR